MHIVFGCCSVWQHWAPYSPWVQWKKNQLHSFESYMIIFPNKQFPAYTFDFQNWDNLCTRPTQVKRTEIIRLDLCLIALLVGFLCCSGNLIQSVISPKTKITALRLHCKNKWNQRRRLIKKLISIIGHPCSI